MRDPDVALAAGVASLSPRALWRAARRQPPSFWMLTGYFFLEYVRPQSAYPQLDFLPFALLSLVGATAFGVLESTGTRRWTSLDTGLAIYSGVVLASIPLAFDPLFGLRNSDLYFSWIGVYLLMTAILNTQTRLVLFLLAWFLWNLKMTQHAMREWVSIGFAFRDWGVGGAPGWFQNSGEFGIQMCVIMPVALMFALGMRPRVGKLTFGALLVLPATAVAGAIVSSSRGALLGMAAVALWMLMRSKHRIRGLVTLAVVSALVIALVPPEQKARFSASGSDDTSVLRLTYWKRGIQMANTYPVLGVGHENWLPYYSTKYGSRMVAGERVQLPHNIFIEAVAELGYTGLLALLGLMTGTFVVNRRTRRLAGRLGADGRLLRHLAWGFDGSLIGFVASGFFVTVLYYPYLWVNLGFTTALFLSTRRAVQHAHQRAVRESGARGVGGEGPGFDGGMRESHDGVIARA